MKQDVSTEKGAGAVKPRVSPEVRQQVLTLRRTHSLRAVAESTGLPIGTVKTVCSRSGAFKDNLKHREMFSLPPIRVSTQTLPAILEMPTQQRVTGDDEIDAVIWLREVIGSGQAALIEKAMEAAKRIKTPLKEIEGRYLQHLVATNPGNSFAAFGSFGFADLDELAKKATEGLTRYTEAVARFGDAVFDPLPAEVFCNETLVGVGRSGSLCFLDDDDADARFKARPELMPQTLSDCLHELVFWQDLYHLRRACSKSYDHSEQCWAREHVVLHGLAAIRPRNRDEALAVFRWLAASEYKEGKEVDAIVLNLIG